MKKLFVGLMLLATLSVTAYAGNVNYHARPDGRDCRFPYCGGSFLVPDGTPDACLWGPSDFYVTGIYVARGPALISVYPPCEDVITGTAFQDPVYPDFLIFVLNDSGVNGTPVRCDRDDECGEGQRCCYPCGVSDCHNVCMAPASDGECPLFL